MNHDATYQTLVANWMNTVFEGQGGKDIQTRCFRFLEEALELVQALGCTKDEALQMVEYTFARPVGEPVQEVGGTLITLMALCTQAKIDAQEAGYIELRRVWQPEVMEKIRAKQKSKPKRGPLPGSEIDTGDHVHHGPTGEHWVVAFVHAQSNELCAAGWPETYAKLSDCTLTKKATRAERQKLLESMAGGEGARAGYARDRLERIRENEAEAFGGTAA